MLGWCEPSGRVGILGEESLILPFVLPLVAASLMGFVVRKAGL